VAALVKVTNHLCRVRRMRKIRSIADLVDHAEKPAQVFIDLFSLGKFACILCAGFLNGRSNFLRSVIVGRKVICRDVP